MHQGSVWQRLGTSSTFWPLPAQSFWNGMNGEAADVLTAGTISTVDLAATNGVPATATTATIWLEARWTAASSGNHLTVWNGDTGGFCYRLRATPANFPIGRQVTVGLEGGRFRIEASGINAEYVTVRLLGYTI
jgi:hypothetical protein